MRVGVIGTGYVGLVSGVCLASQGHDVVCYDLRADVVDRLNAGQVHFHEPGLPALLAQVREAGRFSAATIDAATLAAGAHDLILLAVGTPSTDGRIDLSQIAAAARLAGQALALAPGRFTPIVVKSTVVPGATDTVVRQEVEAASGLRLDDGGFGLGMNPEFLREGKAVEDFLQPDRIVIGYEDQATRERLRQLYAPWDCDKIEVNTRTAEMIKYANNCLLALQISATNELANVAAAVGGIDISEVMRGVHSDKRWSPLTPGGRVRPGILEYLKAGCGFGGSCFPKDVQAMRTLARDAGIEPRLLQATLDVNDQQPGQLRQLLEQAWEGRWRARRALLLGCAFKADTDDVRESVSLRIAQDLLDRGVTVRAHDPVALDNFCRAFPAGAVERSADWVNDLAGADAVIVATAWPEYGQLPAQAAALTGKVLIDARRMFDASLFPGADYRTIGFSPRRPALEPALA